MLGRDDCCKHVCKEFVIPLASRISENKLPTSIEIKSFLGREPAVKYTEYEREGKRFAKFIFTTSPAGFVEGLSVELNRQRNKLSGNTG